MQQKIADDMLMLTRNLKEQSQLANKIIKRDTEVASNSSNLTEKNFSKLKAESDKLAEHSRRACKCWMWVMLIIVMVLFISKYMFSTGVPYQKYFRNQLGQKVGINRWFRQRNSGLQKIFPNT